MLFLQADTVCPYRVQNRFYVYFREDIPLNFIRKVMRLILRPVALVWFRLRNNLTPKKNSRVLFIDAAFRQENCWALMEAMSELEGLDLVYYAEAQRPGFLPVGVGWCMDEKKARRIFFSSRFVFYSHAHLHRAYVPGRDQTVVNMWHGTPMKDISSLQEGVFREKDAFSYVLSASPEVDGLMLRTFGCPREKTLTIGYPRNDWLFSVKDVFSPLGIDRGAFTHVAMWMPTFRKSSSLGRSDSDRDFPVLTPENVFALDKALREREILLVIKPHPAADALKLMPERLSNIIILTNDSLGAAGIQAYELLGRCDILLTDYSSVYFDFLITGKPILFVFDDFESYKSGLGFFFKDPLAVMPGPKAHTVGELLEALDALLGGEDMYVEERKAMNKRFNLYSDGKNRARIIFHLGLAHE